MASEKKCTECGDGREGEAGTGTDEASAVTGEEALGTVVSENF
jgi:hypothetical protein